MTKAPTIIYGRFSANASGVVIPSRTNTNVATGTSKAAPKAKNKRQHEIQIIADVGHDRDAFRRARGQKGEHQWEHHEIGERAAQIEQQRARYQQRQGHAPFVAIQTRRDEAPELIQQIRARR